ncbi:MAG: SGNH/GDSL hydrolase family protein [Chlorobi bacterium]|nr:SGNH/GDSL hydrolase family protein [Chlorobiota bacterium]
MKNKLLFTVIAIVISLIILIIGAEIIARIFIPEDYVLDEMNLTYRYDKKLGWFPIENSEKTFTGSRLIHIKNNKIGFRDIDHGPKSKKRIAFIGDSFVWGYDVEYGERFTEYLQQRLTNWEIINMGVSGYSTDQELILLKNWFDYFKPDIVFLVVCDNDKPGNATNNFYSYYKPYFTFTGNKLVTHGIPVSKSIRYYEGKYPRLLKSRLIQALIQITRPKKIFVENPTEEIIKEMDNYVKSKGAKFFIALTDDSSTGKPCSFCDDIPYVLLTTRERYKTNGQHWTPAGNKIVSNKIYEFLKQQHVLADSSDSLKVSH